MNITKVLDNWIRFIVENDLLTKFTIKITF